MKYVLMFLDIFTPLVYEAKAAIDNTSGIVKGVVIFVSVVLISIYIFKG